MFLRFDASNSQDNSGETNDSASPSQQQHQLVHPRSTVGAPQSSSLPAMMRESFERGRSYANLSNNSTHHFDDDFEDDEIWS